MGKRAVVDRKRAMHDVAPMPVAVVVGQEGANGDAGTESEGGGRSRLPGIRLINDYYLRVVGGYVDDLWVGRHNLDNLLSDNNRLFIVGLKSPIGRRRRAHNLDCFHDIGLLCDDGAAEFVGPVQVLIHAIEHVGELQ